MTRRKSHVERIHAWMKRRGWMDRMYSPEALAAQEVAIYAYKLGVRDTKRRAVQPGEKQ